MQLYANYSNQKHIQSAHKCESTINRTEKICDTLPFSKNKAYWNIEALEGYSQRFYTGSSCQGFFADPQILSHNFDES